MRGIVPYACMIVMSASVLGQGYEDVHLDFNDPEVLVGQIESALTNGVPRSVIVSNIAFATSFQPVSALGACLDFDFATNDIVKTADAFANRVCAIGCLFETNTYSVSSNLYASYFGFCASAFSLAERRDKSIADNWFAQHPLEPIDESMTVPEILAATARRKELGAKFGAFMETYMESSNSTSAYWKIYYNYNQLVYFGPRFREPRP